MATWKDLKEAGPTIDHAELLRKANIRTKEVEADYVDDLNEYNTIITQQADCNKELEDKNAKLRAICDGHIGPNYTNKLLKDWDKEERK